ncbi:MAG: TetR/AcrR family transcriptional regulator [Magnetospiraceae bacterium]
MPRSGAKTREKILDSAQALILSRGFGAATVDRVIESAGITKGAFFYHFKSKADLALALMERYASMDEQLLFDMLAKAERLSRDPLQQILILIGLFTEFLEGLDGPVPGCLIASFAYQRLEFDDRVNDRMKKSFLIYRETIGAKFAAAMKAVPPRIPVSPEDMADAFLSCFEGGFVMSMVLGEPRQATLQLTHYRNYIEVLFLDVDDRREVGTAA